MRSESERAYQNGGLAQAFIPETDPMDVTGAGDVTQPTDYTSLARMNRDKAMQRLRAGQEAVATRRAKREEEDERSRWLALSQAMLSPTKTGGMGENIGMAAGALREEAQLAREAESDFIAEEQVLLAQEADVSEQYLSDLLAIERGTKGATGEYARRRPIGVDKLYPHPEDESRLARGQQIWDPDLVNPDGTKGGTKIQWLNEGPDGSIPFAIDALDLERARQLELIEDLAAGQAERMNNDISAGRDAWETIPKYEQALTLLADAEKQGTGTGGWVNLLQNVSEWFGVDTSQVTTLGHLRNLLGQQVLQKLEHFPGQISEGERKFLERLETALSKPAGINRALLEDGLRELRNRHRRGVAAAWDAKMPHDLRAMGVDPTNFGGLSDLDQLQTPRQTTNAPGSSEMNPVIMQGGEERPPAGTWVTLPDGRTVQVQ